MFKILSLTTVLAGLVNISIAFAQSHTISLKGSSIQTEGQNFSIKSEIKVEHDKITWIQHAKSGESTSEIFTIVSSSNEWSDENTGTLTFKTKAGEEDVDIQLRRKVDGQPTFTIESLSYPSITILVDSLQFNNP